MDNHMTHLSTLEFGSKHGQKLPRLNVSANAAMIMQFQDI